MKTKTSFIVGAVALTVASISAQAQSITGGIDFVGGATIDSQIGTATTFETFFGPSGSGGPVVQAGAGTFGSYAGVPGATVANFAAPFDFASPTLPFPLWTFSFGGVNYSFQVNTVTTDQQTVEPGGFAFINIGGVGTGNITGFAATPETWSITGTTANDSGLTIAIGDSQIAVPEPSTFAFAGLGSLLSLATLFRRK